MKGCGGELVVEDTVAAGELPAGVRVSRFGRSPAARVQLIDAGGDRAVYRIGESEITARVPGGGPHRALSLGAVLCVLDVLGRDPSTALDLPDTLIAPGRGRAHTIGGLVIIDDSYNANPESMRAALLELARRPEVRRYALLGEMLELGDDGPAYHRALADAAADLNGVFCVGEGMRVLYEALPDGVAGHWCAAADDALTRQLKALLQQGDVLLVKGSNRVFWAHGYVTRLIQALS